MSIKVAAEKVLQEQESLIVRFSWQPEQLTFGELLELAGNMPIPPYLNRESENIDKERYQTVYAQQEGSVAAPTAGLHFSPEVFNNLLKKQIQTSEITLHVGAGTFKPVKATNALEHPMHTEHFVFYKKNLESLLSNFNNITVIGTTSLRALESLYWIGAKLALNLPDPFHIGQFEPYQMEKTVSVKHSLEILLKYLNSNDLEQAPASTSIMIFPGYSFHLANRLVTNFHQPQSTLLLLVAAFVGEEQWKNIYDYALNHDFRFLSYGDSSLLFRS
jgi:S-adenosylmethionine:tRNA ribosyltransferase-isomerase